MPEQTGGYRQALLRGRPVAGLMPLVQQAGEIGGAVLLRPIEIGAGRLAILADPQGASFAVIALSEQASEHAG